MNQRSIYIFICSLTPVLAIGYLFFLLSAMEQSIWKILDNIPLFYLLAALFCALLAGMFNAFLWLKINKAQGAKPDWAIAYQAWAVARIFRYLPGKVAPYLVRHGVQGGTKTDSLAASFNEILISISALLGLALLFVVQYSWWFFGLIFLLLIFSLNVKFIVGFVFKLINFSRIEFFSQAAKKMSSPIQIIGGVALFLPGMLLNSLSFYILLCSLGVSTIKFSDAAFIFYLSGLIGQLAIIAPAGLGVRELALTYLSLQLGIDTFMAVSAALISRAVLFFSEVFNIIISSSLRHLK